MGSGDGEWGDLVVSQEEKGVGYPQVVGLPSRSVPRWFEEGAFSGPPRVSSMTLINVNSVWTCNSWGLTGNWTAPPKGVDPRLDFARSIFGQWRAFGIRDPSVGPLGLHDFLGLS